MSRTEAGRPLGDLLFGWIRESVEAGASRARVRAAVVAGAVRVDGVPLRTAGRPLRAGQKVEAALRKAALRPAFERTDRPWRVSEEAILYRDEWLIAVDKPPGLPTHASADPRRPSLVGHLEGWLASGGLASLGVHQRLDRDTSGVVLFALTPEAGRGLARAFESREVEKTYLALASGAGSATKLPFVCSEPLRTGEDGRVHVGGAGARPADTEVALRERLGPVLLVEARPRTGRKHQVRVHLAHAGLPVLGDRLYGGDARAAARVPRLMLHAWRLALAHPVTGKRLVIEAPLPEDFQSLLQALRAQGR